MFPATTQHTRVYHPLVHFSAQDRIPIVQAQPTVKMKSAVHIRTLGTRPLCHFTCQRATRSSATLCNILRVFYRRPVIHSIVASEENALRTWYLHPAWGAHGLVVIQTTFHRRILLTMFVSRRSEIETLFFEVRGSWTCLRFFCSPHSGISCKIARVPRRCWDLENLKL